MNLRDDVYFMSQALVEAKKSVEMGEIPVGAVIVSEGSILSRGYNQPISGNDPTAHAEVVAIRKACQKRGNYRLPDCDLFVTLEPCAMCLGAAVHVRIRRLVYGASDPKSGAVKSIMSFPFEKTNHKIDVRGELLADESKKILQNFFKNKRK